MREYIGKYWWRVAGPILGLLLAAVLLDSLVFPLPNDRLFKQSAKFVYSRDHQLINAYLSSDDYWRKQIELKRISPILIGSVLASEDRWFYFHPGVNLVSLVNAAIDNVKAGKIIRGGSTITMQIARMMEPKPRTIKSKLIEILRSFQLEAHFTKDELLEMYFNLAPYGGNIEGVGAASYFYFDKPPSELTVAQTALLTILPNSPSLLNPTKDIDACIIGRNKVLDVLLSRGLITRAEYDDALLETINPVITAPPDHAPHFCRDFALAASGGTEVMTTIDMDIQNHCHEILKNYRYVLQARDIHNASLVVLDNMTGELLAMIGSIDFNDNRNQGQVNGSIAARSPGSTLKPFVYALAMDKGLISPNMYLEDLPVYYSGYSPENFDDSYSGIVSASDALKQSLNVPAVNLASKVGLNDYFDILKRGGLSTLEGKYYDYGLPLVLGSCEIKLVELANLYRALANSGIYSHYKTELNSITLSADTLYSTGASYIVTEILSELKRPEFPASWEFSENIPRIAWKTGTSYGRKDAWSVGYNPQYTVAVWAGNFDAQPSPELIGAEAAAPILFDIFTALTSKSKGGWFERPKEVDTRLVCAASGLLPGTYCESTVEEMYIPGVSPTFRCEIHKEILVDSKTGHKLCRYCRQGKECNHEIYEVWPAKIATWLSKTGNVLKTVPNHNPECRGVYYGDRPIINSPKEDVEYFIRGHIPLEQQCIMLDASVASGAKTIYWFVDGVLFCDSAPGKKAFYQPEPGIHTILCSDDQGRSSSIDIEIIN